jgi:hypothetical protein
MSFCFHDGIGHISHHSAVVPCFDIAGETLPSLREKMYCSSRIRSEARSQREALRDPTHFLQELVVDKRVKFVYCPTDLQLADFFTKSLDPIKFRRFRDFIMS